MTPNSLDILLIEDNPGDARLVQEMIESIGPLERRLDVEFGPATDAEPTAGVEPASPDVVHADRLSTGLDVLERDGVDIVLLDLNLPDSRGLDTLDTVLEHTRASPVVVLTGVQDREVGLDAIDHGAQEYLVKDEINADLLVRTVFHAIQRERYERALERQHERLASLYGISEVVQDIAGDLIELSTSGEIDSAVCDRLAGSRMYRHAWVGHIDETAGSVSPRSAAVDDGFFEGWTVSIEAGDPSGPVATAALTGDVEVVRDVGAARGPDSWREHAREFSYRSVAAFPIEYDGGLYGILVLYSERPRAFEEEERGILERLASVVGHAINAVERKAALMSDAAIELELLLPGIVDGGRSNRDESSIEFLATIPAGDGTYLQYANVEGFSEGDMTGVLEAFPGLEEVRVIEEDSDRRLIEARYADPPILSTLATHGGRVRAASLSEGNYHTTITLHADADVRAFLDAIRESYPDLNLVAQRSVEPSTSPETPGLVGRDASLTDKQRAALQAAYFSGYFDQPRASTGEEIASSLDITASTFHQHLQAGLRKILSAEFEGSPRVAAGRS